MIHGTMSLKEKSFNVGWSVNTGRTFRQTCVQSVHRILELHDGFRWRQIM